MSWVLGEGSSCKASPLVVLDPVRGEIHGRMLCHEKNAGMDCTEFTPKPTPLTPPVPAPPRSGWEGAGWSPRTPLPVKLAIAIAIVGAFLVAALWARWWFR